MDDTMAKFFIIHSFLMRQIKARRGERKIIMLSKYVSEEIENEGTLNIQFLVFIYEELRLFILYGESSSFSLRASQAALKLQASTISSSNDLDGCQWASEWVKERLSVRAAKNSTNRAFAIKGLFHFSELCSESAMKWQDENLKFQWTVKYMSFNKHRELMLLAPFFVKYKNSPEMI